MDDERMLFNTLDNNDLDWFFVFEPVSEIIFFHDGFTFDIAPFIGWSALRRRWWFVVPRIVAGQHVAAPAFTWVL